MAYNIIQYDSSNLKILNNIETLNGNFISNGQNVITNVSNYVLSTSNTLATHLNDLNSKIFDSSNLVKINRLPVAKYDANGSALGVIKVDGITITVDEAGIIRGNSNIDLTAYATKSELSSVASGLTVLENADLATTTNINLSGSVDYTTTTIDGSWPTSGSSILVKNQTNKAQNGIYILTLTSAPTYSTWQRRSDFNTSQNIKKGSYIFVKRGVENKNTGFISSLDITTLNTDPIDFNLFTKTEITAGTGIAINGSTVSIKATTNGGIVFNSDSAEINLSASSMQGILPIVKGGTGTSSLANLINLNTDTNSILPISKGGTGASSFTNLINLDTDTNSILPITKGGIGASSLANLINLSSDTNGILPVAKGGTGVGTLVPSLLVVGNGTNIPLQSANLSWNNDTNTLAATNITGSGTNITNINVGNASAGILPIVRGGTGSSTLTADIITQGVNNRFIINNKITLPNQQDLRIATNILPDENDKYSLGSSNLRWKDIFVSANTITIGEAKLSSSPTGALEMSSVSFTERINLITSNELHSLKGITKNVQQQINELNLDDIADGAINRYIKNDQYDGSITVYSNLNVGTYYSTENPDGNLRVFGDLILEGNITTVNPLITQIHRHLSNYNTGFIDIHNIDVSSNKPSIKIKHNTNYSNIFECYSKNDMELNDAVFIISSNGNVGINNSIPVEKLDVIGNIKYTGKINNISAAELDKLSGINYNIKQRIDNNNEQQSNFTLNVSNILQTEYKLLDRNVSNFILNVSNILQNSSKETNVSNYILSVSNMLTIDYKRLDNNVSNYILNVSNLLSTDYKLLDKNVSNYVLVSNENTSKYASNLNVGMSNYLATSINTTSNVISSRISLLTTDNIAQGTQNKYITNNTYSGQLNINSAIDNQSLLNITASQNNTPDAEIINIKKGTTELFKMISNGFIGVRKGTNLPTVPLDVEGDIKFTGKINDITAGELNNLKDINYNIKQRIDTNDSRQSNYISEINTSLSQRIDINDSRQSNYISAVNTNISQNLNTNDSRQSNYISAVNTNISQNLNTNDSRQSNYISAVNTNISQRITNITTDTITQGTQKKFIIDDIYNGNLIINSNLTVHGSTTTLNTDVYTTERLDITNINQMSTALTVRQMGESNKIISALKDSEPDVEIFSVNTDGSIDVKGNINFGGDLFKGAEKFKASNWTSNVNGITSYSNVAIGKDVATNSAYKLDVGGNVNISGDLYKGGSIFKASNWTSNANGITSYSNVAIGKDVATNSAYKLDVAGNVGFSGELYKTTNNSNYLIQTVKSDLYIRDPSTSTTSNLTAEPSIISSFTFTETIQTFTHSGGAEAQTTHTVYIGQNTICDILIVGGGGGGGNFGGGGGGGILYGTNISVPAGSYTILVGSGGSTGTKGNSTIAFGATVYGGGFGANFLNRGGSGGSGGGAGGTGNNSGDNVAGTVIHAIKGSILQSATSYANNGGIGGNTWYSMYGSGGGGGGGAGSVGSNGVAAGSGGNGGNGILINISGNSYYWSGGGGGTSTQTSGGNGGLGGGGGGKGVTTGGTGGASSLNSGISGATNGGNGGESTGGGGGGGGTGGKGGSGIVIIKFKSLVGPVSEGSPITHKTISLSYSVEQPTYTLLFPVPTITDILDKNINNFIFNNSNLILQGAYDINLTASTAQIIPKQGSRYLPTKATSNLSQTISFRYNLRNPIKTIEGAQWTYNTSNANTYHLGSVGIGTTNPEYLLDVSGDIRLTGDLYKGAEKAKFSNWSSNINGISSYSNIAIGKEVAVSSAYKLDVSGAINSTSLNTGALTSTSLNTGVITSTSYIRPSAGSGANGIIFPENPGIGNGDVAWIKYYPRNGEACSLEIGINNDADDHIILQPNAGSVGINKVPDPAYKLDVEGSIKFNGNLNKNINSINYAVETVRSELYVKGNDSVLSQEPTIIKNILQPPAAARNFIDNSIEMSGIIPMQVTGSYYHTTFLTSNFKVYSCGYNQQGELGLGNFGDDISTPTQITANGFDNINIINIASKENHTLFVTSNYKVYSCGNNGYGQLGRDTSGNSSIEPVQITLNGFDSSNITSTSCGNNHSLFLTSNFKVYSCGHNGQGQLGHGTIGTDSITPTEIRLDGFNQSNIISIAGGAAHSLFLTSNYKVFSCGHNGHGQLGHGTIGTDVLKPTKIILDGFNEYDYNVIKIASGQNHNLFLTSNYKVYSCGYNYYGQLGRDTGGQNSIIPTQITYNGFNNLNIVDISCGNHHSLFLDDTGKVYGCGYNNVGQTGRNTGGGNFYDPRLIIDNDFNNVKINSIFGIGEFSIFLTSNINDNNTTFAYGCGLNYQYQLGIGNTEIYQFPVPLRFFAKTYKYLNYEVSFTSSSSGLKPYNCFNDISLASDGKWAINYNADGTFNASYNNYYNNIAGYYGNWIILKVPIAIKPSMLVIKQSDTNINGAPKNFRLYASNDKINWDLFIDKYNTTYTNNLYTNQINTENTYNFFALVVSALIGNETALCINEIYIYGKEATVAGTDYTISTNSTTLTTSLFISYDIAKANNYTITFPVSTIANVNNNYNLIFINSYNLILGNNSYINPLSGQNTPNIPKPNVLYGTAMSINYHLRNPVRDTNGAQWTYNAANTSVYHLGNVGIGNTNPIYSLDVVGNMYVNGNIRTSDTITSFGDYSDERLKDREGNIENPLDIIGKLQGFYYKPNKIANDLGIKGNKTNKRELGVSAQDVQKILPELIDIAPVDISYDAENNVISKTGSNYLTVNYEKMIPLLIESIKELNKNINELKKENVELRDLIKSQ
jgi:alpha-tubulin suppressor-like RCC1 family protein